MNEITSRGWRTLRDHQPPHNGVKDMTKFRSEDFDTIPATRFFDQLSFVGNEFVGCFVLETDKGLILIDCMEPGDYYAGLLERGLLELGLDPYALTAILITHGHFDHFGNAAFYREKYGAKIYMSRTDEAFAQDAQNAAPGRDPMRFSVDGYLTDGEDFCLGSTRVRVCATPGHTPGGLSLLLNVTDEGRPHTAALWGGTGIPRTQEARETYLRSSERFTRICLEAGVDAEISTHPFVDQASLRLRVCREIVNGVANPFVIGTAAAVRYHEMFSTLCRSRMP